MARWLERSRRQQAFVAETLALDRVLRYLREGKAVLNGSFCYQDLGKLFDAEPSAETGERHLTQDVLAQLYDVWYPVDIGPLIKVRDDLEAYESMDEDEVLGQPMVSFQEMKAEVTWVVGEHCPQWFHQRRESYWDATDRMFGMDGPIEARLFQGYFNKRLSSRYIRVKWPQFHGYFNRKHHESPRFHG
ncbi:MAG: hypothetical protein ACUVV6_09575 [Thermoplasmatota archaeon]